MSMVVSFAPEAGVLPVWETFAYTTRRLNGALTLTGVWVQ